MPFDQDRAFEVEEGIIIEEAAGVFSGSISPVGVSAPQGSLYLRTNGETWRKFGSNVVDWEIIESGGSGVPNIEGGAPDTVYTADQCFDGGDPSGN